MWKSRLLWVSQISTLGHHTNFNPLLLFRYWLPFCVPKLPFATILPSWQLEIVASLILEYSSFAHWPLLSYSGVIQFRFAHLLWLALPSISYQMFGLSSPLAVCDFALLKRLASLGQFYKTKFSIFWVQVKIYFQWPCICNKGFWIYFSTFIPREYTLGKGLMDSWEFLWGVHTSI